jgi:multiple sugar transport system permease protein
LITVFVNSVIISLGTMALTLLLAVPGAYGLARLKLRGSGLMLLFLLIGQLLPSIVIAGPLFLIFSRIGLLNSHLGLILADTTFTLPFSVIILRPFFLAVPRELEAAAKVDGCTQLGVLWHIVIPYVRPGLITVAALTFLIAWGEFIFALSLNPRTNQPVTVALNKFIGQYGTHWNDLMAVSTVVALPIVLIFASLQRFIVGGLTSGAVKE